MLQEPMEVEDVAVRAFNSHTPREGLVYVHLLVYVINTLKNTATHGAEIEPRTSIYGKALEPRSPRSVYHHDQAVEP